MIVRAVEIAVLAAGFAQVVRFAVTGPLRRELRATPLTTVFALATGAMASTAAVVAIIRWPALLHATSPPVAAAGAVAWWRARPTYGRRRALPPGSLGLHESIRAVEDKNYYVDRAQRYGPVFKMSQFGRPVVCVLGLERARRLLHEQAGSVGPASLSYNRLFPKGTLRYMEEQDHREEAPLFRAAFAALDLQPGERALRVACQQALRSLSETAGNTQGVDPTPFLNTWVERSLASMFFGVEPEGAHAARLATLQGRVALNRAAGLWWRRRTSEVFSNAISLLQTIAGNTATVGGPDHANSALGQLLERDPHFLEDANRAQNLILGYRLAVKDVSGLLQWIVSMLAENPQWQDRLAIAGFSHDTSYRSQPSDLGGRIVLETLRMEQSEYLYRRVTKPITIDGFRIPRRWLLRICVHESHRDPTIFREPDRFDPDRFVGAAFSRNEYSPFGADNRGCIGVAVVHVLGRIFVEELCAGYSLRITTDALPRHGTRHHDHWSPSPQRRYALVARRSS